MSRIGIVMFSDLSREPRVVRQIHALRRDHEIVAFGFSDPKIPDVAFHRLPSARPSGQRARAMAGLRLLLGRFDAYYWNSTSAAACLPVLRAAKVDLFIAHDDTLPVVVRAAGITPVVFDAHEYFPRHFEDQLLHRLTVMRFNRHFCLTLMPTVAASMTVSDGIADQYAVDTGTRPTVWLNCPFYEDLPFTPRSGQDEIRMIHHGWANQSRRIDALIEMMRHLDHRFTLDLMLMSSRETAGYLASLKAMAAGDARIRFLAPLEMRDLVAFSSAYDVGVYLLPPNGFNHLHALPNKLFEFIQGRLAPAVGPLPEMSRLIRRFECGVVSDDFSPQAMAGALLRLSRDRLDQLRLRSHQAARELSAESQADILRRVIDGVLVAGGPA